MSLLLFVTIEREEGVSVNGAIGVLMRPQQEKMLLGRELCVTQNFTHLTLKMSLVTVFEFTMPFLSRTGIRPYAPYSNDLLKMTLDRERNDNQDQYDFKLEDSCFGSTSDSVHAK